MKNINTFNIEFDGIDKCGKDTIKSQIWYFAPGMYLPRARGLMSQLAYAKLYERKINYNVDLGYIKNTCFVLLDVDEQDWEIRCKLTNEPNTKFSYSKTREAFFDALIELKTKYNVSDKRLFVYNTTYMTPFVIAKDIVSRLEYFNG